jgi:hypothetical protein
MNIKTSILRSVAPVAFTAMSLHALGCIAGPSESGLTEEDFLGTVELGVGGDPGTENHYDIGCFLDHGTQQTFRSLAAGALTGVKSRLPTAALAYLPAANATGDLAGCRQQALDILVECALGPGQEAVDPQTLETHTGELNWAPDWTTRALTTDEKELVTACMLQRLNPQGVSIAVLLERPSAPNTTADYPLHESETWGNLFDSTIPLNPTRDPNLPTVVPFDIYSCDGGDRPSICEVDTNSVIAYDPNVTPLRTCYFNSVDCSWNTLGACLTSCPYNPYDPTQCDAWDNRLRSRLRDDGSSCGIPIQ